MEPQATFALQNTLASLPMPSLEETINKYLVSLAPIVTEQRLQRVREIANDFLNSDDANKMQDFLNTRASQCRNWLEEWWNEIYMTNRCSLLVQNMGTINPRAKAKRGMQINVAAQFLHHMMSYWSDVRTERVEVTMSRGNTWDMSQTHYLFNSTRVPQATQDKLIRYFKTEAEGECPSHVIVLHNGHIWKMKTTKGGKPLSPSALFLALTDVVTRSSTHCTSIVPLTTLDRDRWAQVRNRMESESANNRVGFEAIDTAAFVLSLTSDSVESDSELMFYSLFGSAYTSYCDKLNIIVMLNAKICQQAEHANVDAIAFLSPCDIAGKKLDYEWEPENTEWNAAQELRFDISEATNTAISDAEKEFRNHRNSVVLTVFKFKNFGSQTMKSLKVHTDTVIQIALQLAFSKTHARLATTYETASTRIFYHGRTETVRSLTPALARFVQAYRNGATKATIKRLFMEAYNSHNELMEAARNGRGIDRHFLGLKKANEILSARGGVQLKNPLFDDPTFTKAGWNGNFKLSTSLLGYDDDGCFGYVTAMCPDGYGAYYKIGQKVLTFTLTCYKNESVFLDQFCINLQSSLDDVLTLLRLP